MFVCGDVKGMYAKKIFGETSPELLSGEQNAAGEPIAPAAARRKAYESGYSLEYKSLESVISEAVGLESVEELGCRYASE